MLDDRIDTVGLETVSSLRRVGVHLGGRAAIAARLASVAEQDTSLEVREAAAEAAAQIRPR